MNDTVEQPNEAETDEEPHEWYAVNTFAKSEEEGAEAIEQFVERNGYSDRVQDILVPMQTQKEVEGGDAVEREKPMLDGYLFIKADLNKQLSHKIQRLDKVIGFVGPGGQPVPVSDTEMDGIMEELERDEPKIDIPFEEGDTVRITEGAMEDMTGTIDEIDFQSNKLHVAVDMFGRETNAEINFDQADPID